MIEALPCRFDLSFCPTEPLGLMAPLPEISQHVRREIEGLIQGEAPGGDLWREVEVGVAEMVAEASQVDRAFRVSQRERGQMREKVRHVIGRLGLTGAIEIDDPDSLAVDHDVHMTDVAVRQRQLRRGARARQPLDFRAQPMHLVGEVPLYPTQVFQVVALKDRKRAEIQARTQAESRW